MGYKILIKYSSSSGKELWTFLKDEENPSDDFVTLDLDEIQDKFIELLGKTKAADIKVVQDLEIHYDVSVVDGLA